MKKVMSVLALCGLLALSGGSALAAQSKLAHIRPADSVIERDLQAFTKEVREATDGRIDIRIYGSSQLGDYTVVQEKVSLGSVEMSCESVSTQVDKRFLSYILALCRQGLRHREEEFRHRYPLRQILRQPV